MTIKGVIEFYDYLEEKGYKNFTDEDVHRIDECIECLIGEVKPMMAPLLDYADEYVRAEPHAYYPATRDCPEYETGNYAEELLPEFKGKVIDMMDELLEGRESEFLVDNSDFYTMDDIVWYELGLGDHEYQYFSREDYYDMFGE